MFIPVLLLMGAAPATAPKAKTIMPKDQITSAASYVLPEGWKETFSRNQGDPQAVLKYGLHRITVRLSGGEKSRYKKAADFLVGLEVRSADGKAPGKLGHVAVAGQKVMLYKRKAAVSLPLPDMGGPASYADEEFCVVPARSGYFVLSYSYEDDLPDSTYDGAKVWHGFLKSFRLKVGRK
ncbi:MAG: hypothetical protein M0011_07145 [Elusimicrobia bacterium]|nr:hypothetical protein [Elusimicrobiota bacterium]